MRADNDVDSRHRFRQFAVHLRALMRQHHDHVGPVAQPRNPLTRSVETTAEAQAADVALTAGLRSVVVGQRQNPDPHRAYLEDLDRRAEKGLAARLQHIGAAHGKVRDLLKLPHALDSIIEIVVAKCEERKADRIHQLDRRRTLRQVAEKIVAEGVAATHQENVARALTATNRVDRAG